MHPEGVQLLCVGEEGVRPLQGRGVGEACRSPGALRRADECDPFRVEDGGEADANKASEGSSNRGGPRTFNANVGQERRRRDSRVRVGVRVRERDSARRHPYSYTYSYTQIS